MILLLTEGGKPQARSGALGEIQQVNMSDFKE